MIVEAKERRFEFSAGQDISAQQLLMQNGFSKRLITKLKAESDGIMLNGVRVRSTTVIPAGQRLEVTLPHKEIRREKSRMDIPIVYEDEDIIILDKPAGIVCHRSGGHICDTVENTFEGVFRAVTRLDKDTSGLMLAAKHQLAAGRLWQNTEKIYLAVVDGCFDNEHGFIELPILKIPYQQKRLIDDCGDPSRTEYRVISQSKKAALLECRLLTGRGHQARVHLSAIGHPILGDELYGGESEIICRQALHCAKLKFFHPISEKPMCLTASPHDDMLHAMELMDISMPSEWKAGKLHENIKDKTDI